MLSLAGTVLQADGEPAMRKMTTFFSKGVDETRFAPSDSPHLTTIQLIRPRAWAHAFCHRAGHRTVFERLQLRRHRDLILEFGERARARTQDTEKTSLPKRYSSAVWLGRDF